MSVGVEGLFNARSFIMGNEINSSNYLNTNQFDFILGCGAWVDATYVRFSVDLLMSFMAKQYIDAMSDGVPLSKVSTSIDDYAMNAILITLVGKYPFNLGKVTIFPELGIAYNVMFFLDQYGDGHNDLKAVENDNLSDLYIITGIGTSVKFNSLIFNFEAQFGPNVTPNPITDKPADSEYYSGWFFQFKFGIGYLFNK